MNQLLKMKNFKARSIMRPNRRFFTSAMKSTGLMTRLQRRKNLNISRKSWKKSAPLYLTKLFQSAGDMPGGMPGSLPGGVPWANH